MTIEPVRGTTRDVVSKTTQRVEKCLRWPPRAARTMLPSSTDLMACGARRAQGRCLSQLLRSAASEGEQSLDVLARGDQQSFRSEERRVGKEGRSRGSPSH